MAAKTLLKGLVRSERASLARAITLVESTQPRQQAQAQELMGGVLQQLRGPDRALSLRIGLSGPPGAGKSTFIESLGTWLTANRNRVAVLVGVSVTHVGSLRLCSSFILVVLHGPGLLL